MPLCDYVRFLQRYAKRLSIASFGTIEQIVASPKKLSTVYAHSQMYANATCSDALMHLNHAHIFALMIFRSMKW